MVKINKEISCEQGREDYYLFTGDFSSLQMRLACIDTVLNGKIDKNLFSLYKADSPMADAHCKTGHGVFCESIGYKAIQVENSAGEKKVFGETEKVKVNRDGKSITVLAKELKVNDEIEE